MLTKPELEKPGLLAPAPERGGSRGELLTLDGTIGQWRARVEAVVRPERLRHIERVAALAEQIARANRLDARRAAFAGLVHDVARDLSAAELYRLAPPENEIDASHALAVHGRAGRALLERWGLWDEVVLEAVEDHTTGPRGGNPVAVAVYVADVSEPGRGVNDDIRRLAMTDIAAAYRLALSSKVNYLRGRGIAVHPRTLAAYRNLGLEARFEAGAAGAG